MTDITASYNIISMQNLLEMKIPEREWIAYPFIQEKSLTTLYAERGIGKTYFAITLGMGIASGKNVFNFTIKKSHSVLYIDGEMTAKDFQDRVINLGFGMDLCNSDTPKNFHLLSNDLSPVPLPNLCRPDVQEQITPLLRDFEFIIIDNLSALCSFANENEAGSWTPMQKWLIDLKRNGKSVLIIDHSGKDPELGNRGTSKKQDVMDSVISLSKPATYNITDGSKFVMYYKKARNVAGSVLGTVGFQLESSSPDGFLSWSRFEVSDKEKQAAKEHTKMARLALVEESLKQGKSYRQIAEEIGVKKSTVGELAKQLKQTTEQEQPNKLVAEPELKTINLEDLNPSMFPD